MVPKLGSGIGGCQESHYFLPDYRFIPESTGLDILDGLDDLWTWLHTEMPNSLEWATTTTISANSGQLMTVGDSAGEWGTISQSPRAVKYFF